MLFSVADEDIASNKALHSIGGLQNVQRFQYRDRNLFKLMQSYNSIGLKTLDCNSMEQEGVMVAQFTQEKNTRMSAYSAFVKPILKRPNLKIIKRIELLKLLINPKSKTSVGIQFVNELGDLQMAFIKKELIVSAGSLNSPRLLMNAGIGPEKELKRLNITIISARSVGQNFQDHISFDGLSFSLFANCSTLKLRKKLKEFNNLWYSTGNGPMGSVGPRSCSAFVKSSPSQPVPDIQILFDSDVIDLNKSQIYPFHETLNKFYPFYNVINVKPVLLRPKSRGYLQLNEKSPIAGKPLIYPEYLREREDVEALVGGVETVLKLMESKYMKEIGAKLVPYTVKACNESMESKEYWRCVIRHYTKSVGPSGGTCKMGLEEDQTSVVNDKLQVHGVSRLRVVDSSIMPTIVSAVSHAPVMMIAEKAADMIKNHWA